MRRSRLFLATLATLAFATPATAAQTTAGTTVKVFKPVQLQKLQDMDFGTLSFGTFTGPRTIVVSQAGAITCALDVVCSGVGKQARFNLKGSNNLAVNVTYTGGNLSNGTPDVIPFTANGPATVTPPNSGNSGIDFNVGGSIEVNSALVGGIYTGTMTITADYP